MSRTQNAIKNAGFGILGKIINLIFVFISKTVFIYILGTTYLGVNGLFTEVLSLLSFAELGFGAAMTFAMYKLVADNDEEQIIRLLDYYKKVYRVVALVILLLGLSLVPFIGYIVKGADWLSINELRLYFVIFLFNTVTQFFVTYKYTYINALQKNYITTNIETIINIITNIFQIIVIIIFKNFLLYLLTNSFVLLLSRLFIIYYLNKKYPILNKKASIPLTKEEKLPIYHEVKGLAVHHIASAMVHSTDNLIISSMISVVTVGLISNYTLLINGVLNFVDILFNSVVAGLGNLVAESSIVHFRKVFKEINFVNFWIYGFCCIAFWILIPPFITLWIGNDKLIDNLSFTLIIINTYLQGQSKTYNNARIAKGNFNKDKWWAIIQAIVNLVVSILAARQFGLVGVYMGTIASRLIYVIFRPYATYEFLFGESSKEYYKYLIKYFIMVVMTAIITKGIVNIIMNEINIISFIISVIVVAILPNIIFLLCNFNTNEFKSLKERLLTYNGK